MFTSIRMWGQLIVLALGGALVLGSSIANAQDHFTRMQTLDCTAVSNASVVECESLRDIYFASDGANWTEASNWGTTDISTWARVQVTAGEVTALQLDRGQNGPLSPSISGLQNLTLLSLNAPFTGTIPDSLGGLTGLEQLTITNTNFSGSIPAAFSTLSSLDILVINQNDDLGGNLPPELGQLNTLEILRIGGGQFTGTIPTLWSGLTSLEEISIIDTGIGGEIPVFFANIPRAVIIHDNQFSGLIPAEFGNDIATPDDFRAQRNRLTADGSGDALMHTAGLQAWFANQGFVGAATRRLIGLQSALTNSGPGGQHAVPTTPLWVLVALPLIILGVLRRKAFAKHLQPFGGK